MLYSQPSPAIPSSAAVTMSHPLVTTDTRRFLKTSHWISPSMPARPPAYASKSTKRANTATSSTSRIDKRKRRRPIRSLPAPDDLPRESPLMGGSTPRTSCSLKMSYLDDYQRNPTAYSRALMGTLRPLDGTVSCPNSASVFAVGSKPLYYSRRSQPSTPHSSRSLSTSSASVSPPSPAPETPNQQQPQRRKSAVASVVRRLFPSLDDDSLAALAAEAAAQPPPPSSPRPKKKRDFASSPGNDIMTGEFHSTDIAQVADPGSNGDTIVNSGAEMQTPQTINNGNDAMYVGDKLGREIFQLRPQANSCPIKWTKAAPMNVTGYPLSEFLAPAELDCCATLRLQPEQYLAIKHSLVRAGRTMTAGTFKKRDAQKLCRVDVNKTSKVFEWFCKLGWIPQAVPKFGSYYDHIDEPPLHNDLPMDEWH